MPRRGTGVCPFLDEDLSGTSLRSAQDSFGMLRRLVLDWQVPMRPPRPRPIVSAGCHAHIGPRRRSAAVGWLCSGLLAGCAFVASEPTDDLPIGPWQPNPSGLRSERSPVPASNGKASGPVASATTDLAVSRDAGFHAPVGPAPDSSSVGVDVGASMPPEPGHTRAEPPYGEDAQVAFDGGDVQTMEELREVGDDAAGGRSERTQTRRADAGEADDDPEDDDDAGTGEGDTSTRCTVGERYCDGLDNVVCEAGGSWSRRRCEDRRDCFEASCDRERGCMSRSLRGAPCSGGPGCTPLGFCVPGWGED